MVNVTSTGPDTLDLKPGPVCRVCPLFSRCRQVCDVVEAQLPSMERGRVDSEDLPRLYLGVRLTTALLDNMHLLTPRQQEVVRLYYRDSLRQQDIARILRVSQQAVNDALQRARGTIGSALKSVDQVPKMRPRPSNLTPGANGTNGTNGTNGMTNGSSAPGTNGFSNSLRPEELRRPPLPPTRPPRPPRNGLS